MSLNVIVFGDSVHPKWKNISETFFKDPFDRILISDSKEKRFKMIDNYYIFDENINKPYNFVIINVDPNLTDPSTIKEYVKKYVDPFPNAPQNPCALHILIYYGGKENNLTVEQKRNFITDTDSVQSIIDYHIERDSQYHRVIQYLNRENLISNKPKRPIINKGKAKEILASNVSSQLIINSEIKKSEEITIKNQNDFDKYVEDIVNPLFFSLDFIKKMLPNNNESNNGYLVEFFKTYFKVKNTDTKKINVQIVIDTLDDQTKKWMDLKIPTIFVWFKEKLSLIQDSTDLKTIMQNYKTNFDDLVKSVVLRETEPNQLSANKNYDEKNYELFLASFRSVSYTHLTLPTM
jgi:hypothetical protein